MLTVLGSLIGFLSSTFPAIIKMLNDRSDKKQELAILDRQIEIEKIKIAAELEELKTINGPIINNVSYPGEDNLPPNKFVTLLKGSVRPILSYAFFAIFVAIKVVLLIHLVRGDMDIQVALNDIWDDETKALFAAIMSFWFGGRAFDRK